jgi:hypothetical protein
LGKLQIEQGVQGREFPRDPVKAPVADAFVKVPFLPL